MYNQVHQEQIVATVQPQVIVLIAEVTTPEYEVHVDQQRYAQAAVFSRKDHGRRHHRCEA